MSRLSVIYRRHFGESAGTMQGDKPTTILVAEDNGMTRFGLTCALRAFPDLELVAECQDGMTAVMQAMALKPNVILMDIGLPKIDGIKAAKQIKDALPETRVIMFTASNSEEHIYAALQAGADGYCLKNVEKEHLYSAIKAVTRGVSWLDPGIADRVLRSGYTKQNGGEHYANSAKPRRAQLLSESQLLILQLLSQGADLDDVVKQFNLSTDSVSEIVNDTIAKLSTGNSPSSEKPSVIADRYKIETVLGRGGMGIVYKGRHLLMDRPVAIKMLHPEYIQDEVTVNRFRSEAKSLSTVIHPNLVTVFDFGITPAKEPYLVMDYYQGKSLEEILDGDSAIELKVALDVFCQVCDALTAVHKHNIVHRDVKPANILISDDNQVKLVDFGIAKSTNSNGLNLTMDGEAVGTPKYMSPEQCQAKNLDARSDIYSLGCVMYEVITGRAPFEADSFYEMMRQHTQDEPSKLPFLRKSVNVTTALQTVILKSLKKAPQERHQSAAQLKQELLSVAQ